MDNVEVLNWLDNLFFEHTGKPLDTLQKLILQGSLEGRKYSEIANIYKCTEGHVRDEASGIWKALSKIIGEDICKSNFGSVIDRLNNFGHSTFINSHNFGVINFHQAEQSETSEQTNVSEVSELNNIHKKIIPRLLNAGLDIEQIAGILDISPELIAFYFEK